MYFIINVRSAVDWFVKRHNLCRCLVFIWCFIAASATPQPIDISLQVPQGSGKFAVLRCINAADCSNNDFLVTSLPGKGQLFRAQGVPDAPVTTFIRSDVIATSGIRISNRIVYYLPFHEVHNDDPNIILSDSFKYKANVGSNEAVCLIEILGQQLLPIGGGSGYSLLFDGVDDVVVIPVESWFPVGSFTIMMWVRVYDNTKQATIVSFFGKTGPAFEIYNARDLTCIVGFSILAPSKIDISDGKWHHLVATWSSSAKTCRIIVDSIVTAVAIASDMDQIVDDTGTIVLGNRQACGILDDFENIAVETELKAAKTIMVGPIDGNDALNYSTTPTSLLLQHVLNRAHGSAAPLASLTDSSQLHEEPYVNARQRSDFLLCRCTGGCFNPNLAFGGEIDDFRIYDFEKTASEIRVESKYAFFPVLNATRPQLEQQFFGLRIWLLFDSISGVDIADSSGNNRKSFRGSSASKRFPCHKKREPIQVVSTTGVLGGPNHYINIDASTKFRIKLPGIAGVGNDTSLPRFRFNKKYGGGTFYNAACSFSGSLTQPMIATAGSLIGETGCIFYTPNVMALQQDGFEYSISNVDFGNGQDVDPSFVDITYTVTFFRESNVIPSNYLVGLQSEAISIVKLIMTRTDLKTLRAEVTEIPKFANVWIAIEARCEDVPECQSPLSTLTWETSGSSFIDETSLSKFSDWKYVQPPFGTPLYQVGPKLCSTDAYFTPEVILPSTLCKIGKYYMNDTIFMRHPKGSPMFLNSSKWEWVMWEMTDFSASPYGDSQVNVTLQGVIIECLIYGGSVEIPLDNSTSCYISNCFPPDSKIILQSAVPLTPAAVLRAVLSQKLGKLDSLLKINARFDRLAITAAAALGNVEMLRMLLNAGSVKWDYDAIEIAEKMGSIAAADYLRSRATGNRYEGIRNGSKCLVRGDSVASFTGFVTKNPYFLASGSSGMSGNLGALKVLWSKMQLTDQAPNFPASRTQIVSFWGSLSRAPKPDGNNILKDSLFQGLQDQPIVVKPATVIPQNALKTCVRLFIKSQPLRGKLYNVDDSFGLQRCQDANFSKGNPDYVNEITCREFGAGVYFMNVTSNQSTFSNSPKRPIVYPSQITIPAYEPMSGVEIKRMHYFVSQNPVGILNASKGNKTGVKCYMCGQYELMSLAGPRFGKDGGREDLEILDSLFWDRTLEYGRIHASGSNSNASFYAKCGNLGFESVAFRFKTIVFPTEFSFIATIEKSSSMRILAKAPKKRSQIRNFAQSSTRSSQLVYNRFIANISDNEYEIFGISIQKPAIQSLRPWQYVTGDTDGAWINLWEGQAEQLVSKGEPMKHKATFCTDASSSWLETDTILIEVCGLGTLGTALTYPGLQLEGVANAQLIGTRGGSLQGLVQSVNSHLVYMPNVMQYGDDSFDVSMKDLSNGLTSNSEKVQISTIKRPAQIAAANIEATVPFNHSVVITLSGFVAFEQLGSFFIESKPSHLILKQYDGLLIEFSGSSGSNSTTDSSQILITDNLNRMRIDIPDFSVGAYYDSFQYSVGVIGSAVRSTANVTIHVWCRSRTYHNTTLNRCLPCVAGTFNEKMSLSKSCQKCPAGSDSKPGSLSCLPCPKGTFASDGALCSKCLPGTYSPSPGQQQCTDCQKGTFSQKHGSSVCDPCGNQAYVDESRSTSCKSCPMLTMSNSKRSQSVAECKCTEGSYEPKGAVGKDCLECPTGAYCHGDRYPPVTKAHYWTLHSEWDTEESPEYFACDHRGVRNVCRGYPEFNRVEMMSRCAHRGVNQLCDEYPSIPTSLFGNASAFDDRKCSIGYTGRICSNCDRGYYIMPGGTCNECPNAALVLTVTVIVIVAFVVIAAASASPIISIYISVSNFQNLAMLGQFGIPHPPALATMWGIISIFNLNFELVPFQCILGKSFDWVMVWYLESFALSIIMAACIGRWIVPYLLYRPLLNKNANRTFDQSIHISVITQSNQHGSYRPSRPSTPSSQRSYNDGKKIELQMTQYPVVVDFIDGAPNIDADVFEDDSESLALDAVNLQTAAKQNKSVRKEPIIAVAPQKIRITRTGLISAHSASSSAASSIDLQPWEGLSMDELDFYLDSAVWIGCFLLEHFFLFSSMAAFRTYACRLWTPKMTVLKANPAIVCWGESHNEMIGIGTPMLLINAILHPVGTMAALLIGTRKKLLQSPKFTTRWGFLMERFEQEYYWWQMVVISRKLLLAVIATFMFSDPYLQVALSCIVLSVNLVLNLMVRPFKEEHIGTLDSVLMVITIASFALTLMNPIDMIKLNTMNSADENSIVFAEMMLVLTFVVFCCYALAHEIRKTEYELPQWFLISKHIIWDQMVKIVIHSSQYIKTKLFKDIEDQRTIIQESNRVRLSRIQSAVRKDVEKARLKKKTGKEEPIREKNMSEWNRHMTDTDIDIRQWDSGDVLPRNTSWRSSSFDIRKRIFVLERLLQEEALHDSKSPKILNYERDITTALKISLQAMLKEQEVIYESLYDTETECDALEQEKNELHAKLASQERRFSEMTEKNAFLKVTLDLASMGLSDESEWKEKLKDEEKYRKQLEQVLLKLQSRVTKSNLDL